MTLKNYFIRLSGQCNSIDSLLYYVIGYRLLSVSGLRCSRLKKWNSKNLAGIGIFLVIVGICGITSGGHVYVRDGAAMYMMSRSMLDNHWFDVPEHPNTVGGKTGPDGKYYTLMQAAYGYGLGLFASSSLLQMNLFKGKFSDTIREALHTNEVTDVATALQFARSGNVLSALFGSINPQHIRENLMLAYLDEAKPEQIHTLFGEKHAV